MENQLTQLPPENTELLELGALLGQNHAFGLVAGRCSAAQAETLRRLREEKTYKRLIPDWRDFCASYLNMSGAQADRIIGILEQFGLGYFELAQLTRISAETYRVVEPVVRDHTLHFKGEAIALDHENARKVAAVVAELRREAAGKKVANPREMEIRVADLEERFGAILADIEAMLRKGDQNGERFSAAINRMSEALACLMKPKDV